MANQYKSSAPSIPFPAPCPVYLAYPTTRMGQGYNQSTYGNQAPSYNMSPERSYLGIVAAVVLLGVVLALFVACTVRYGMVQHQHRRRREHEPGVPVQAERTRDGDEDRSVEADQVKDSPPAEIPPRAVLISMPDDQLAVALELQPTRSPGNICETASKSMDIEAAAPHPVTSSLPEGRRGSTTGEEQTSGSSVTEGGIQDTQHAAREGGSWWGRHSRSSSQPPAITPDLVQARVSGSWWMFRGWSFPFRFSNALETLPPVREMRG
eukprot:jgi/Botrbrau1/14626/Bobra.0364s0010.1